MIGGKIRDVVQPKTVERLISDGLIPVPPVSESYPYHSGTGRIHALLRVIGTNRSIGLARKAGLCSLRKTL